MCKVDTDCGAPPLHCFDGSCAQCEETSDCADGQQCVAGVCQPGCKIDEDCPLFNECKDSECIAVGCKSARECYFSTKNPLSECKDHECITPCTSDTECGEFNLCSDGRCTFVGCKTDDECRVLLGLAGLPGDERAVCREPDDD